VSREEQRRRFLERIEEPNKNWKFSLNDVKERGCWDDYQAVFSEMLSKTSTEWAPWYVVPGDHKWFARICVSAILALTLMEIDPRFPEVGSEKLVELEEARRQLEAEAPAGAGEERREAAGTASATTAGQADAADKAGGRSGKKARKKEK
jgi:hypothetical protein